MTPAEPFVGAVTTRPPAAFSSFTAIANALTMSMARKSPDIYAVCCRRLADRATVPGVSP